MQKFLATSIIATLVLAMLLTTITQTDVFAKKYDRCNNVKIQVRVTDSSPSTEVQDITASATLNGVTKTKTQELDANETKITIPLSFKKLSPCPVVGDDFNGDVEGTSFSGEINSIKKPNKVSVTIP